jgi:hypothetical protein
MIRFTSLFAAAMTASLVLSSLVSAGEHETNACSLCPDGSQAYNKNKIVPFDDEIMSLLFMENVTCRSLDVQATSCTHVGHEFCTILREYASWCECPGVEPGCLFCAPGMVPANPDVIVGRTSNSSCADWNFRAHFIDPNDSLCEIYTNELETCGGCVPVAPSPVPVDVPENVLIIDTTTNAKERSGTFSTDPFEKIVMAWEKPLFEVTGGMFFCILVIVVLYIYCIRANVTQAELGQMLALLES